MFGYYPYQLIFSCNCPIETSSKSKSPITGVDKWDEIPEAAPNIFVQRKQLPLLFSKDVVGLAK